MGTVDKLTELQYRRSVINNGGGEVKIKKQQERELMLFWMKAVSLKLMLL